MIIFKKAIPRRTMLKGLGAAIALPILDSMVPAMTPLVKTAGKPVQRFGVIYVAHGASPGHWIPATEGAAYELTEPLRPLAAFRDRQEANHDSRA